MGPVRGPGGKEVILHDINRTPEYDEFIQKLTVFHEKRGSAFEPEPKLPTMHGHVKVDLLKLYKAVIEKGGYDEMNKVQKAWGALAGELGMFYADNKGMGQLSFQLKQDFYRYLAAYWIQDQYGREPPPKEILEQQSCASKHGPLLTRTVENFKISTRRPGEETPVKEERPPESAPTSANRASGRLREAPPQRVPFQPDTGSSRQSRSVSSHHASQSSSHAQSSYHASQAQQSSHHVPHQHNPNNPLHVIQAQQAALRGASSSFTPGNPETASRLLDTFEPRHPTSVPLRPVNTPGNNPAEFAKRQRQLKSAAAGAKANSGPRPILPPTGFEGASIYTRCLQALRSGLPDEQAFALNHLVKISYERGDKYKFEVFPGLAEGLIEKGLEVGSLFYHVEWQISYSGEHDSTNPGLLDGLEGTSNILERIRGLSPKIVSDQLQPAEFSDRLLRITEAVLTLRNMTMLFENAVFMADVSPLKDLLCILLQLPNLEILVEIKHFALDIAEQITPWLLLDSNDPLYRSLLAHLDSNEDRGAILTALRAISRISMNLDATNKLQNVPALVLRKIKDLLLLNDEELMDACLDFLYQYTAVVANIESLLEAVNMENIVPHLVRLLAHGARRIRDDKVLEPERKALCTEEVAPLPIDITERLKVTDEPQRCLYWLQTLFEEDPESHITQIAIWQAYQQSFGPLAGVRNFLSAADFIRNVSHVFVNARAQIIRGPGEVQRFIIEGIRARTVPVHFETKEEYMRCQWQVVKAANRAYSKRCNQFFLAGEQMWHHVVNAHLGCHIGENGQIDNREVTTTCDWGDCNKYSAPGIMKLAELTRHLKTHFPAARKRTQPDSPESAMKRQRRSFIIPPKTMSLTWEKTQITVDERKPLVEQAAGIPLSAVLVLRNIARNVVKTESEDALQKKSETGGEIGGWNERLFRPVMGRLFEVMTENRALAPYVTSLLQLVQTED